VGAHEQVAVGADGHIARERDPQGLVLGEAVPEGAGAGSDDGSLESPGSVTT
jgi:hypothetical protein